MAALLWLLKVEEDATSQESLVFAMQWLHSNDLLLLADVTTNMTPDEDDCAM